MRLGRSLGVRGAAELTGERPGRAGWWGGRGSGPGSAPGKSRRGGRGHLHEESPRGKRLVTLFKLLLLYKTA